MRPFFTAFRIAINNKKQKQPRDQRNAPVSNDQPGQISNPKPKQTPKTKEQRTKSEAPPASRTFGIWSWS
jgi:hypothetical protein